MYDLGLDGEAQLGACRDAQDSRSRGRASINIAPDVQTSDVCNGLESIVSSPLAHVLPIRRHSAIVYESGEGVMARRCRKCKSSRQGNGEWPHFKILGCISDILRNVELRVNGG